MLTSFPKLRWIAALALLSAPAYSADLDLNNINLADYESVVKEFSSNSQYTTVTPASSLGGLWGFELGITGGISDAKDTEALVKRNNASTSFKPNFYHAGALARLGLPYGVTLEGLYIPKTTISSVKMGRWGIGAQWTITDVVLEDLPVHLAIKTYYTKTTLNYGQTINNATTSNIAVPATVNMDNSLYGFQLLVSHKIFVLEPYAGIGWTKAKGTLTVDASVATAGISQSLGRSAESTPSSAQILAGVDLRLAFFSLGAEWERVFKKNSYTGRLSFRF